jgi:hypothetical protein
MTNVKPLRDPKTGRFQSTTDTTRYKMVQFNNQRMSEHAREICISLNIPKIPKGFVVHHLDENKRNNHIDNLALVTTTAHNRIHSHEAWNKGIKKGDNKIFDNALFKIRISREKHFFNLFKKTYELKNKGLDTEEISKKLGISRSTVKLRIKRYIELKNKYEKN